MIAITTEGSNKQPLTLTRDHLVYVSNGDGKWSYLFAERTQPGMLIKRVSGYQEVTIEAIKSVER